MLNVLFVQIIFKIMYRKRRKLLSKLSENYKIKLVTFCHCTLHVRVMCEYLLIFTSIEIDSLYILTQNLSYLLWRQYGM